MFFFIEIGIELLRLLHALKSSNVDLLTQAF